MEGEGALRGLLDAGFELGFERPSMPAAWLGIALYDEA